MSFEETKTYLGKIKQVDNAIDAMIEDTKSYMDLATKTTGSIDTNAAPSAKENNDKMAEIVGKIVDTKKAINYKIDWLIDYKRDVSKNLRQMKNKESEKILVLHYIRYMSMEDIAEEMGYSTRTILRKHKTAVQELDAILSDSDKRFNSLPGTKTKES